MFSVTVTTSAPPVTVVWSKASPITTTVTMTLTSVGLAELYQHDVVLPPLLILKDTLRCSISLTFVLQQQQPQSQMPSQAYANYVVGPSWVSFLFQSQPPTDSLWLGACYNVCFLPSDSNVTAVLTYGALTARVCNATILWSISMVSIYASLWWSLAHTRSVLSGCSFHYFKWGELMPLIQLSPSHSFYMAGHTALGVWQSHLIPPPSLHGGRSLPCSLC